MQAVEEQAQLFPRVQILWAAIRIELRGTERGHSRAEVSRVFQPSPTLRDGIREVWRGVVVYTAQIHAERLQAVLRESQCPAGRKQTQASKHNFAKGVGSRNHGGTRR